LVSLVDSDRQWFKAKVGLDVPETSRDLAFCSHVIAQCDDRVFVVSDALEDERFMHSDLVLGAPGIRFYAGVPLILEAEDGSKHKIGTLCIIDREPRTLDDCHRLVMETLAQLVVSEIDRRRTTACAQAEQGTPHAPAPAPNDMCLDTYASCASESCEGVDEAPASLTLHDAQAMWEELLRLHWQQAAAAGCWRPSGLSYDGDAESVCGDEWSDGSGDGLCL
jgi:hypothetical protein